HNWQEFRLGDSWDALARKKVAQQTAAITAGQLAAANTAANNACASVDGVVVNGIPIMNDPRACTWSATNNICGRPGAPAAPNCLDEIQAAGIDRIWDGPRNSFGKRIWFPNGRGIDLGVDTQPDTSGQQIMHWAHLDPNFDTTNL